MGLVANGGRTRVMKGLRGSKQLSNLFFKFIQHCNKVLFFFFIFNCLSTCMELHFIKMELYPYFMYCIVCVV